MSAEPIPFLRTRLSIQMFLQFAIWGAWAPVLVKHLSNIGFTQNDSVMVMGTGPLAIMISPLIAGQIADRYFSSERFLAFSYFGAGIFLVLASMINGPEVSKMWWISLASMLLFGPTLGLGNSICFHHLADPRKDFPLIRVWGTIGWIATAFFVTAVQKVLNIDLRACLYVGAALSFVNALYCLTLPHTPPSGDKREQFAAAKVFGMLRDSSFALFTLIAFVLMIFATQYYFTNALFFPTLGISDQWLGPTQTIGQVAEIGTMFILPLAYTRLGSKPTIAIGIFAWALRFAIFALGTPTWLVIAAQALHGVCFAFAIAGAMIYFERICTPDVRASMQSFLTWIAYGFGMFVGSLTIGFISAQFSKPSPEKPAETVLNWHGFWAVPAAGCFVLLLLFLVGFKARDDQPKPA